MIAWMTALVSFLRDSRISSIISIITKSQDVSISFLSFVKRFLSICVCSFESQRDSGRTLSLKSSCSSSSGIVLNIAKLMASYFICCSSICVQEVIASLRFFGLPFCSILFKTSVILS